MSYQARVTYQTRSAVNNGNSVQTVRETEFKKEVGARMNIQDSTCKKFQLYSAQKMYETINYELPEILKQRTGNFEWMVSVALMYNFSTKIMKSIESGHFANIPSQSVKRCVDEMAGFRSYISDILYNYISNYEDFIVECRETHSDLIRSKIRNPFNKYVDVDHGKEFESAKQEIELQRTQEKGQLLKLRRSNRTIERVYYYETL